MPASSVSRRNGRVPCGAPAQADGPRGPLNGRCRNISVGGMFFLGGSLPVGKVVELRVDLPTGRVEVQGEVRYHLAYPEGEGMGVRFMRLSGEHLALVTEYVQGAP